MLFEELNKPKEPIPFVNKKDVIAFYKQQQEKGDRNKIIKKILSELTKEEIDGEESFIAIYDPLELLTSNPS